MKRILLISDTHDFLDPKLLKHIGEADEVWHGGDIGSTQLCDAIEAVKPLRAVYGNIDDAGIQQRYPENLIFDCEGLKVVMTHIGGYPGKYPSRIKQLFKLHQPKLFICGHSHILKVMYDKENELLHINPGACGSQGFHKMKTAVKFNVNKGEIQQLAIIELGLRSSV